MYTHAHPHIFAASIYISPRTSATQLNNSRRKGTELENDVLVLLSLSSFPKWLMKSFSFYNVVFISQFPKSYYYITFKIRKWQKNYSRRNKISSVFYDHLIPLSTLMAFLRIRPSFNFSLFVLSFFTRV